MTPFAVTSSPVVRRSRHRVLLFLAATALAVSAIQALPAGAQATPAAPGWTIDSFAIPTNFSAADNATCLSTVGEDTPTCDAYQVTATNAGHEHTDGSAVTLSDTLPVPVGLTVQ